MKRHLLNLDVELCSDDAAIQFESYTLSDKSMGGYCRDPRKLCLGEVYRCDHAKDSSASVPWE